MQRAPVLPKGWPPLGPSAEVMLKIRNGKILSESELDQLRQDGARAERLEATDPDYQGSVFAALLSARRAVDELASCCDQQQQRETPAS